MARLHTSFILGYHGCDRAIGEKVLSGNTELAQSEKDYDWLGPGVYFWEADPRRAYEWALEKKKRKDYDAPYVIGAVIDLGNCLDLLSRQNIGLLSSAYTSLKNIHDKSGTLDQMPQNEGDGDKVFRRLDCAVIRHLHEIIDKDSTTPSFDSVRGLFSEGDDAYPGGGFKSKTHVQIAVRNSACLKGYFRVDEAEFKTPT